MRFKVGDLIKKRNEYNVFKIVRLCEMHWCYEVEEVIDPVSMPSGVTFIFEEDALPRFSPKTKRKKAS